MRRILVAIIAAALVVLAAVLIIRTNRFQSRQLAVELIPPLLLDTTAAVERLAGALRFRTISNQDSTQFDAAEFRRFQDYLRTSFPRLHARLGREITGGFSLLYEWRGSDTTLKPILLMAHQDVVPVEPGTEGRWTEPPFEGPDFGRLRVGPRRDGRQGQPEGAARGQQDAAGDSRGHGRDARLHRA